ncbi:urease accessory protein UreD [Actinomadura sp. 9N407]|uniref:urease accessory protein UreD n=1 Tax=Actinomadura sp. 9N407 TaxID=3375154 RepID=UPI0037BCFE08
MTRAPARLATSSSPGGTHISVLRSSWPLMLRTTAFPASEPLTKWACRDTPAACVHLAAGGAGPLGGDRLRLEVDVGAGSTLLFGEVSPTLLLPGPRGEESRFDIRVRIGAGATLAWLPELVIAAHGCRHITDIRVTLERGARLVLREEILFGRHGETPGSHRQRVRIVTDEGPLYDQELGTGPSAPGWDGPAVTAGHRTAGTLLLVDPDRPTYTGLPIPDTAFMELHGNGVLCTALAPDTTALRHRLDAALDTLLGARAEPSSAALSPAPAG